jgi:hypothetical protein
MRTSFLKPGLLVSLKTSVQGGVRYYRRDLAAPPESDGASEGGATVTAWETTRITSDADEHDRAIKARGRASRIIRACCRETAFGLMCAPESETDLGNAIDRATAIVDAFNADAKFTRIRVSAIRGRIAETDEQAARAIAGEVADLIEGMTRGIDALDAKAIRDAATRAQVIGAMLEPREAEAVGAAIKAAREAATKITKRIAKDGATAATVLAEIQRGALDKARIMFLDLDTPAAPAGDAMPAVDLQRVADLDLDATAGAPAPDAPTVRPEAAAAALDLDGGAPVPVAAVPVASAADLDLDTPEREPACTACGATDAFTESGVCVTCGNGATPEPEPEPIAAIPDPDDAYLTGDAATL